MIKIAKSFGTHDGAFHADEVTACALLLLFDLIDRDKIIRTRDDEKFVACEFVCDVGGVFNPKEKRFDHHQSSYQGDLSSAGMVLDFLCSKKYLDKEMFSFLRQTLVKGVDDHDNGKAPSLDGICTFSHVIAGFVPTVYESSPDAFDEAFFKAVEFALGHLKRSIERAQFVATCKEKVKNVMAKGKFYLVFDEAMPWLENFFALGGEKHPALYLIMPSSGHWKLRAIPPSLKQRMGLREPLPEEWAGLLGYDLKKASGIDGAIFCHKGRFTSVWETKEDAIKALKYVLKKGNHDYDL